MSGFFNTFIKATSGFSADGSGFSGAAEGADMRFTIQPTPGESGFSQWAAAMKMVAQLPGGIPPEFRKRLWLTLSEKHLASRGIDWKELERNCFSEWSHPADAELGVQIVKDLHRTGCSLFCGEDGQENQALLKRVLVAYARWNKAVGYCQGFNMLAALILQVTDKNEADALKLMIYLIEGVLPDSYFADSLRGLSVDMAVFRELLRTRLPRLSRHLDSLQNAAKDGSRSYEPPLTNVFTMQWFLTLFCNCLPQPTVLRVWDLILLEGNEILLRTALGIWQAVQERILQVRSADEFYCIMGVLTREILEFGLVDANSLIKAVVAIGPLTELKSLREHYLYNINPWGPSIPPAVIDKQLKLYHKHSIALDIGALKKQYSKLKQRQRQAHIIFSAAISRQPPPAAPVAMNHLLLGKSALVPSKRIGPPKGTIPPQRQVVPSTLHWKDAPKQASSSSSSDTELCDEDGGKDSDIEVEEIPKDKESQFENDNLVADLMIPNNDNMSSEANNSVSSASKSILVTSCGKISSTDNKTSDNFDTKITTDSDDENIDFEHFLAERLKCLTHEPGSVSEESEGSRISYSRRNSERALQIIQENSLILHRILQCQSRMSPSPPLVFNSPPETVEDNANSSLLSQSFCSGIGYSQEENLKSTEYETLSSDDAVNKMDSVNCWINSQIEAFPLEQVTSEIKEVQSEKVSPVYGSQYTGLLEKSKSLDQRYNSLILNSEVSATVQADNFDIAEEELLNNKTGEDLNLCDVTFHVDNLSRKDTELLTEEAGIAKENCSITKALRNSDKIINENLFLLGNIKSDKNVTSFENVTDDFKISYEINLNEKIDYNPVSLSDFEYKSTDDLKYEFKYNPENSLKSPDKQITCSDMLSTNFSGSLNSDNKNLLGFKEYDCETFSEIKNKAHPIDKCLVDEDTKCGIDLDSNVFTNIEENTFRFLCEDNEDIVEKINNKPTEGPSYDVNELINVNRNLVKQIKVTISPDNTKDNLLLDSPNSKRENILASPVLENLSVGKPDGSNIIQGEPVIINRNSTHRERELSPEIRIMPFEPQLSSNMATRFCESSLSSEDRQPIVPSLSPERTNNQELKSPSKCFNPFPVPLNTRQNKEVPLKLGLYKK